MYALVLLKPNSNRRPGRQLQAEHEAFITSLIRTNRILLGGGWSETVGPFEAAYVVRAASVEDARSLVSQDPYMSGGSFETSVVEWELEGITPDAIDPEDVHRPADV